MTRNTFFAPVLVLLGMSEGFVVDTNKRRHGCFRSISGIGNFNLRSFSNGDNEIPSRSNSVPGSDSIGSTRESALAKINDIDWPSIRQLVLDETIEIVECTKLAASPLFSDVTVDVQDIVRVCDEIDALSTSTKENEDDYRLTEALQIRRKALEFRRYELLVRLMKQNYGAYVATASFLSPSRIPRKQLPNVQDVPMEKESTQDPKQQIMEDGIPIVADCKLDNVEYNESPLDALLLSIFRKLVTKNTGGITSDKSGIDGLLEQGRTFMLLPNQTADAQHEMVYNTLGGLMTPVLPPFYRIFMSGIIPKLDSFGEYGGKQLGPLPYASWLTSFVTPTFFGFLVGPSYPNRRKDGSPGGLVVEKCKFLQESGCKGLCLNQCKLPAQQFFQNELGLPLTVSPNFVTQECQWSFGEIPLPPNDDPSFPKGCLAGCESRKMIATRGMATANLCL